MNNNTLFCMLVTIILFMAIAYVFLMIAITELKNRIKDISDNQFDAEQVMRIYKMKYIRPVVMQERADIKALMSELEIPREVCKAIEEGRFDMEELVMRELSNNFREYIKPYIEYTVEDDALRMCKVVKGRLRVVSKNS